MKSKDLQNLVLSKYKDGQSCIKIHEDLHGSVGLSTVERWCKIIRDTGKITLFGFRTVDRRTVARGQLVAGQLITRTFGRNALSMRNMKFEKNRILLFFLWKIKQAKNDVKRFG